MDDQAQEMSNQEQEGLAGDVMESMGMPEGEASEEGESGNGSKSQDPLYVQKRLKQQERAHRREMREMQQQIAEMHSRMGNQQSDYTQPPQNPYANSGMEPNSEDERIHRAVSMALQAKEQQEQRAQESQRMAHVHKQYQALQDHLDNVSGKYDDFDDIVRSNEAPYTEAMRDAALLIPNAGEVLYKLGKNKDELRRISSLHPLEQAKEMVKLSIALTQGEGSKGVQSPKTLGQVKSNPVTNSQAINEKTPVSEIRRRMKAGWK